MQIPHVFSSKSTIVDCYENGVATVTTIKVNVRMRFPASKKNIFQNILYVRMQSNYKNKPDRILKIFWITISGTSDFSIRECLQWLLLTTWKKVSLSTKISSKSSARMRMAKPLSRFLRIEIRNFSHCIFSGESALPNACSLILVPKLEQSLFFHIFPDSPHPTAWAWPHICPDTNPNYFESFQSLQLIKSNRISTVKEHLWNVLVRNEISSRFFTGGLLSHVTKPTETT